MKRKDFVCDRAKRSETPRRRKTQGNAHFKELEIGQLKQWVKAHKNKSNVGVRTFGVERGRKELQITYWVREVRPCVAERRKGMLTKINESLSKGNKWKFVFENDWKKVKLQRANGGYLGTQRRRRTWWPTKCLGELETSIDPRVSEWGNPNERPAEYIGRSERTQRTETS